MNPRSRFMNQVRKSCGEADPVPGWPHPPNEGDLVVRFSAALTAARGEVHQVEGLESTWLKLEVILEEIGASRIVFNAEDTLDETLLKSVLPQYTWVSADQAAGNIKEVCLTADAGVTAAKFALADTGSIGIASGENHARLVSLLPPVHIVLLSERVLVADLIRWEPEQPKDMPSQIVIVSGPSKTADIEQTLVVGAHGPKRLVVIIYGESEGKYSQED